MGRCLGLVLVLASAWVALPQGAAARTELPWCANSSGHGITYKVCDFPSLEACREEIVSMRGWCSLNPFYNYTPPAARRAAPRAKPRQPSRRQPAR